MALLLLLPPAAAQAAAPDKWLRWQADLPDTTIRSLDFIGPTLVAGGESNGVFFSPTAAGPYSQQNTGLDSVPAQSIRQVKVAPSGLYYATTSAGVFQSQPPGNAWQPVGQGEGPIPPKLNQGGAQSIIFNDPGGLDLTVAIAGAAKPGIYNSSDAGASWSKASGLPSGENIYYMTPGVPPSIYAAGDSGVWISPDAGRDWVALSDGIPPGETTLRVSMVDPQHLFASTSSSVYRSTNGGITWEEADGEGEQILPAAGGKRAFLMTPPLDGKFGANRGLVGTESGVYGTIDNGDHWKPMSKATFPDPNIDPDPDPDMNRVVWSLGLGFSPPSILAGTSGFGVFGILPQPIEGGDPLIGPLTPLVVGTKLELTNLPDLGFAGMHPFFFEYQWFRCTGVSDATCTISIPGAIGPTYTIPVADANTTNNYAVRVTARNLVKPAEITMFSNILSDDVADLSGNEPRPKPGLGPSISPNPATSYEWGQVLTINEGQWRSDNSATILPASYNYKWRRCDTNGANCKDLPEETGKTYTSTPNDITNEIEGYVQAVTSGGTKGDFYLAGHTFDFKNKVPVNTVDPAILGDPYIGVKLSSSAGGWDGYDMRFERSWLHCNNEGLQCNPTNPPVTDKEYTLTEADRGYTMQLEVKAIAEDGNQDRTATDYSPITAVIGDRPPEPTPTPAPTPTPGPTATPTPTPIKAPTIKISKPKKLKVGAKLTVPKSFSGFKNPKYQWYRNSKKIRKATKRTYKITKKDRGKKISCRITLTPVAGGAAIVIKTKAIKIPKKKKR